MKYLNHTFVTLAFLPLGTITKSQDFYASQRGLWLAKAGTYKPRLRETIKMPVRLVTFIRDDQSFQGWKSVVSERYYPLPTLKCHYRKFLLPFKNLNFSGH